MSVRNTLASGIRCVDERHGRHHSSVCVRYADSKQVARGKEPYLPAISYNMLCVVTPN